MNEQVDVLPQVQLSDIPKPQVPDWQKEYLAFQRLLPELLKTYEGQYVAIFKEQPVDAGPDQLELVRRTRARLGNVTLHVGLVTRDIKPPERVFPRYRQVLPEPA